MVVFLMNKRFVITHSSAQPKGLTYYLGPWSIDYLLSVDSHMPKDLLNR